MAADAAPDPELARLLDAYGRASENVGFDDAVPIDEEEREADARTADAARAALLAHLAATYVRQDAIPPPWRELTGEEADAAIRPYLAPPD